MTLVVGAVAVAMLVVGGVAGYLFGFSSVPSKTATYTMTTTLNAEIETPLELNHEVADAFAKHMLALSARNASLIASQYMSDTNLTWLARSSPFMPISGYYNGSKNVLFLMNVSFVGHGESFTLGNLNYRLGSVTDHSAIVNSNFTFFGHKSFFGTAFIGDVNGTVSAKDVFARSPDGRWLISQELWDFTSYSSTENPRGY